MICLDFARVYSLELGWFCALVCGFRKSTARTLGVGLDMNNLEMSLSSGCWKQGPTGKFMIPVWIQNWQQGILAKSVMSSD